MLKEDTKIIEIAKKRLKASQEAWKDIHNIAREDIKFAFTQGEQWNAKDKATRTNRPCLEINQMPAFVDQVVGDVRQNKPSIKVRGVDSLSDVQVANIFEGLIRNIEYQSNAEFAYLHGFECAVAGGVGAWRIITQYESDSTFNKEIRIKRIKDPLSVFIDPECQEPDFSDARYGFIAEWISREDFLALYPDANMDSIELNNDVNWIESERVRIAEYFYIETEKRTMYLLSNGDILQDEEQKNSYEALKASGVVENEIISKREVSFKRVKWVKMTASQILESRDWAGSYIPIVVVTGKEFIDDGKSNYRSIIRYGKEPQRIYNYARSQEVEMLALAPKAPILVTEDQIEGHEKQWQSAYDKPYPYLVYNQTSAAPPQRIDSIPAQPGLMSASSQAAGEMKATIGLYNASLGAPSNERTGRAILAKQREGDTNTFAFVDNLSRAVNYTGRILIDLIPKIYDAERTIRIHGIDGSQQSVKINQQLPALQQIQNDLSVGKYDCVVTTGPSYTTQRIESANALMEIVKSAPQLLQVVGDLLFASLDIPNGDVISQRLKRMMPPQVLGPEEIGDEDKLRAQMPQNPQQQMQAQKQQAVEQLQFADKQADIRLKEAKALNLSKQYNNQNMPTGGSMPGINTPNGVQ